jgi:hypothetical protein
VGSALHKLKGFRDATDMNKLADDLEEKLPEK